VSEATDDKPKRLTILEMEIRIWMPMKPGDVFLAKIGNSPVLFQGPSAIAVKRRAEEWRQAEWDKHHKKAGAQ
jgi:hypothetical protein